MTRREFVSDSVAVVCAATVSRMMAISNAKGDIEMKKVELESLSKENAFKLIGSDWMLVAAGKKDKFNTTFPTHETMRLTA